MSTTVVYASGESGYMYGDNATYTTAANNVAGGQATANATIVGQLTGFQVYEAMLKWDTSAVGSDTVSNVDFEVDGGTPGLGSDFIIEGYVHDWGATLTSGDFVAATGISALGSVISSYDTAGGWTTTAGYNNDLGANAAFASAINGSGDTRILVVSQEQRLQSQPTGTEYVQFECTGATNDARLTITHEAAAAGHAVSPTDDITTTGWATAPLWSKVDEDPASPDGTVITATAN